jgi:hypothetical protein
MTVVRKWWIICDGCGQPSEEMDQGTYVVDGFELAGYRRTRHRGRVDDRCPECQVM